MGKSVKYQVTDPRTQLIVLVLINIIGMTNKSPRMEILSLLCIAVLLLWQGMWRKSIRYCIAYAIVWVFIYISIFLPNSFTAILAMIGAIGRKAVPTIMFASSIIANTKVGKLIAALQEIHFPKGITIALAVAIRFFPTLKEEGTIVINSMKMRGLNFNLTSIIRYPILVIENILVPVMMRMTIVADELAISSMTRGIDSEKKRTSYYELSFRSIDILIIIIFSCLSVIAVGGVLRW